MKMALQIGGVTVVNNSRGLENITNLKTVNNENILGTGNIIAGLPAGSVIHVAMSTAPTGYLKANGAAISRSVYGELFAAIGTTYGTGDGSTTFNLPDLRGEFIRGWDDGRGVDSARVLGSFQAQRSNNLSSVEYGYASATSVSVPEDNGTFSGFTRTGSGTGFGLRFANRGGSNHPRNRALLVCIKF
jgi:phage-related tail fiber protein